MIRLVLAVALAVGALNFGVALPAVAAGKPMMSDMIEENGVTVQHVRDALMAFNGVNKHWPANLDELSKFAMEYRVPLDLTPFATANYYIQTKGTASVAVFEFVMANSPTKGAFALVDYIVK